ncbi:MAG: 50S ribosomal protein L13 [Legionellales bacterium]|nr:50S ribosomal protein L13 [Legionellales bacterium]|tara:strand:+ start:99 stop:512 length:414 start_codon:yes stop_codon:yes gene_type:complete
MKTIETKPSPNPTWVHLDADQETLGRLATKIATILQGKHKPEFSKYLNLGDSVVVTNCEKIICNSSDKVYYWHTGFPGGIKSRAYDKVLAKKPQDILMMAVKRMLPSGPRGRSMLKRLRVYVGHEHPHTAQVKENKE